ncbi:MAG: Uncharacterised protein [Pseudidiomarina mangrovi]|nr:MAG: Uncharacterised protein [Pseudidiomarina mangrovi]
MQQRGGLLNLRTAHGAGEVIGNAAFNAANMLQATVMGYVGGFGRPRRNSALARHHHQQLTFWNVLGHGWTVGE